MLLRVATHGEGDDRCDIEVKSMTDLPWSMKLHKSGQLLSHFDGSHVYGGINSLMV